MERDQNNTKNLLDYSKVLRGGWYEQKSGILTKVRKSKREWGIVK